MAEQSVVETNPYAPPQAAVVRADLAALLADPIILAGVLDPEDEARAIRLATGNTNVIVTGLFVGAPLAGLLAVILWTGKSVPLSVPLALAGIVISTMAFVYIVGRIPVVRLLRKIQQQKPDLQIIATTHSPYLLDEMRPEEVRLTTRLDDGSVACGRLDAHPDFERWKEAMAPGEFWSMVGERWVAERQPQEAAP